MALYFSDFFNVFRCWEKKERRQLSSKTEEQFDWLAWQFDMLINILLNSFTRKNCRCHIEGTNAKMLRNTGMRQ